MSKTKGPKVSRLENNIYYSDDHEKAVKELIKDVSKLYVFGYSREKIKSMSKVKRAVNYLKKREAELSVTDREAIQRTRKPEDREKKQKGIVGKRRNRIPSVNKLVDYIFLNDVSYDVTGPWIKFDYLLPLQLLDYAKHLIGANGKKKVSFHVASTLFFIIGMYNLRKPSHQEMKMTQMSYSKSQPTIELLNKMKEYKDDILIVDPVSKLRKLINIDSDTLADYVENLFNIEIEYNRYKIKGKKDRTSLIIMGISDLIKSFNSFVETNNDVYSNLWQSLDDKLESGVSYDNINSIYLKYEKLLIRDKTLYFNISPLKNNPFIRIDRENSKLNCYIQLNLANYKFIFDSLYKKANTFKRPIHSHLNTRILSKYASEEIPHEIIKNIHNKLIATGITKKKSYSEFVSKIASSQHFDQIKKVVSNVQGISNAGIEINPKKVDALIIEINTKLKVRPQNYKKSKYVRTNKSHLGLLKKIKGELNSVKNDINGTKNRIYGYFTPHGAVTHRMTSKKFSFHSFPKEIISQIIAVPANKVLISLDVSGQDITIATNLARKLYTQHSSDFSNVKDQKKLEDLGEKIKETFSKFSEASKQNDNSGRPIDAIAKIVLAHYNNHAEFENIKFGYDEIRSFVKQTVYIMFYGGGYQTIMDKSMKSVNPLHYQEAENHILNEQLDSLRFLLDESEDGQIGFISGMLNGIKLPKFSSLPWNSLRDFRANIKKIKSIIIEQQSNYSEDLVSDVIYELDNLNVVLYKKNVRAEIIQMAQALNDGIPIDLFDDIKDLLLQEYPGILESIVFYQKYYEEHNMSFPTLLNWSTIVELSSNVGKMITKSRSFPIQASGAEFIRQWITELTKVRNGYNKYFIIVNVIHDQIIVEVMKKHKEKITALLLSSAKEAAGKIGIDKDTLFFSDPKVIDSESIFIDI